MLETIAVEDGTRILDVCCGYGPIGAFVGQRADCDLWLSDDDRAATACAECSLRASGVEGTVVTADCVEGVREKTFDRVLCNPPTHAGAGVLEELFAGIDEVLAPDGRLTAVHHREFDLETYLSSFDTITRLATGERHVVVECEPG